MKLYNINYKNEKINYLKAIEKGMGKNKGLYFPEKLPYFNKRKINEILQQNFIERSTQIIYSYLYKELNIEKIYDIVNKSFNFSIFVKKINNNIFSLELFHGPTLAFKDFGCRFMANILTYINKNKKNNVILTATSGDTGAAVAHAFYKLKNFNVVILYPKNKISILQEKLFCTLGKNIFTISVDGDFDDCQLMVKKAFEDKNIKSDINLNSANSINISRILAQICYYFEAVSQLPKEYYKEKKLIFSVPSGNFGNLTAGLLAKSLGLPVTKFIAATNINDTIPRFLSTGIWNPQKTVNTISNAMDVSKPNNWIRIIEIFKQKNWNIKNVLDSFAINEEDTKKSIIELYKNYNYIIDPHTAIAYKALSNNINPDEYGIFLSTAHPAKFQNVVESILNKKVEIPCILSNLHNKKILSHCMSSKFSDLKKFLLNLKKL